jgi:ABC-type transport system involved in Fe-S cluster assembly fused permease/ATPase subunit
LCWFLLGAAIYTRLQVVWFGAYVQPNNIYLTAMFNWFVSLFFLHLTFCYYFYHQQLSTWRVHGQLQPQHASSLLLQSLIG